MTDKKPLIVTSTAAIRRINEVLNGLDLDDLCQLLTDLCECDGPVRVCESRGDPESQWSYAFHNGRRIGGGL